MIECFTKTFGHPCQQAQFVYQQLKGLFIRLIWLRKPNNTDKSSKSYYRYSIDIGTSRRVFM